MSKHKKKQSKLKLKVILIFILVISICIIYKRVTSETNKELYKNISVNNDITENIDNNSKENKIITENMKKVISLSKENSDVKGWIQIDNTIINYPILQGNDNDYYLKRNYKKEKSKYGSIFLKDKCNISDNNSNLIIYGHNMNDSQMFGSLLEYENKDYYNNHKRIKIATENEENEYSIVCVFKSRIFYQDEKDVFRFYNYTNLKDEEEYNSFIENCKKIQLYDTEVNASYGEQLITLITCEYSQENGRLVVIAKKDS